MLFETLGKLKQKSMMTSIIVLAVGIILLICPDQYIDIAVTLAGYVMLIASVALILEFMSGKRSVSDFIMLGAALILAILGLVILVEHENVLPVLSWLFGLFLVLDGVISLFYCFAYARRAGRAGWPLLILLALLQIAAGVIIVINPWWNTPKDLLNVIALALIYSAAAGLLRLIWIWPIRSE